MRALFAIAKTTIRSALRSHVFHVALFFLLLIACVLPLIIRGDHTALGQLQVSLTYTMGLISILLSMITLWLSCTLIAEDIEGYQIHLVVSKPVARWQYWGGKFLGLLLLQTILLLISTSILGGLIYWRVENGNFPKAEIARLKKEVLVGRRVYRPEKPPLEKIVQQELARRLKQGPIPEHMSKKMMTDEIRRQVKAQLTELPGGKSRPWVFLGVPHLRKSDVIHLRYRMYLNKVSRKKQRQTQGLWYFSNPKDNKWYPLPKQVLTGIHHEITLPPQLVFPDGHVMIAYENRDPEMKSVVFQTDDGPFLMVSATGFFANFYRAVYLLFLQLAFLTIIGCAAGANLSTAVAIFMSFSYVVIGAVILSMQPNTPEDEYIPKNPINYTFYLIRKGTAKTVVSINQFNEIGRLTKGELIEFSRLTSLTLYPFLLHSLLIAAIGIWFLSRRELGLVMRK